MTFDVNAGCLDDLSALSERTDAAYDGPVSKRIVGAVYAPAEIRGPGDPWSPH